MNASLSISARVIMHSGWQIRIYVSHTNRKLLGGREGEDAVRRGLQESTIACEKGGEGKGGHAHISCLFISTGRVIARATIRQFGGDRYEISRRRRCLPTLLAPRSRRADARLSRSHFSFRPASAHRRRIDLTEGPVPRSHEPACVQRTYTRVHVS